MGSPVRIDSFALPKYAATGPEVTTPSPVSTGADIAGLTPGDVGGRVVSSGVWALLGQVLILAASLLCTPFVIRSLGAEAYGLLALVTLIVTYMSFADVGMANASTRFASAAHSEGSPTREAAAVWTSLAISGVPSAIVALAVTALAGPITGFFNVPPHLAAATRAGIVVACATFVLRNAIGVLNTPLLVRLRVGVNSIITTACSIAQIVAVPIVLALGGGLEHAIGVSLVVTAANLVVTVAVSARLLPELRRPAIARDLLRPLLTFGGGMVAAWIMALVLVNFEKLMVARDLSAASLAYYTVAHTLGSIAATAPRAMSGSLLPAFTSYRQRAATEDLQRLYAHYQQVTLLWMVPVAAVMTTVSRPFLTVWAGPDYGEQSAPLFAVIIVGVTAQLLGHAPREVLKAAGRPDLLARCIAYQVVPHLVGAWCLIQWLGLLGAAIAWTLRTVLDVAAFMWLARRHCGVVFAPMPGRHLRFTLAAGLLAVPPILAAALRGSLVDGAIVGTSLVAALVVFAVTVWRGILSGEQRAQLRGILARLGLRPRS